MCGVPHEGKTSSVTFKGIAKAMANQWGDLDKQMCKLA